MSITTVSPGESLGRSTCFINERNLTKDFLKKANCFLRKDLPVVYAVESPKNSYKNREVILGKDLLRNVQSWMALTPTDLHRPFEGHHLDMVEFFVSLDYLETSQSLGSAASFVETKKNASLLTYTLLALDIDRSNLNASNVVTAAAMFQAGSIVQQDVAYARGLISTVKDRMLLQATFARLLVCSCIDPDDAQLTRALLELGANPNRPDDSNELALVRAIDEGNRNTVKILLQGGASVTAARSGAGESVWSYLNEEEDPYDPESDIYRLVAAKRKVEIADDAHKARVAESLAPIVKVVTPSSGSPTGRTLLPKGSQ